jgi:hypothetical protein
MKREPAQSLWRGEAKVNTTRTTSKWNMAENLLRCSEGRLKGDIDSHLRCVRL